MTSDKAQKLQKLINTSAILDARERQEWLALLELMNDKQAAELEKILASHKQELSAKNQELEIKNQEFRVKEQMEKVQPRLGHLMNLPKNLNASFQSPKITEKKSEVGVSAEQLIKQIQDSGVKKEQQTAGQNLSALNSLPKTKPLAAVGKEERKAGFWQRIKDVLAEKELPAGHPFPVKELELPERIPTLVKLTVPKPKQKSEERLGIKNQELTAKNNERVIKEYLPIKAQAEQKVNKNLTSSLGGISKQPQTDSATVIKLENLFKFKPGVVLDKIRPGEASEKSLPSSFSGLIQTGGKSISNISSLKDLETIKPEDFSQESLNVMVNKVKPLVKLYGYHSVIFSLEKSPLFKAYINTGIKNLGNNIGLKQETKSQSVNVFGQEDFEKFTDLLMQLQI